MVQIKRLRSKANGVSYDTVIIKDSEFKDFKNQALNIFKDVKVLLMSVFIINIPSNKDILTIAKVNKGTKIYAADIVNASAVIKKQNPNSFLIIKVSDLDWADPLRDTFDSSTEIIETSDLDPRTLVNNAESSITQDIEIPPELDYDIDFDPSAPDDLTEAELLRIAAEESYQSLDLNMKEHKQASTSKDFNGNEVIKDKAPKVTFINNTVKSTKSIYPTLPLETKIDTKLASLKLTDLTPAASRRSSDFTIIRISSKLFNNQVIVDTEDLSSQRKDFNSDIFYLPIINNLDACDDQLINGAFVYNCLFAAISFALRAEQSISNNFQNVRIFLKKPIDTKNVKFDYQDKVIDTVRTSEMTSNNIVIQGKWYYNHIASFDGLPNEYAASKLMYILSIVSLINEQLSYGRYLGGIYLEVIRTI